MLIAREGRLRRFVQVDDLVVVVRQHHAGGDLVERLTDARVFRGYRPLGLDLRAQLALHLVQGTQHLACLVSAREVDLVVVLARGDGAEHGNGTRQWPLEGMPDQPR